MFRRAMVRLVPVFLCQVTACSLLVDTTGFIGMPREDAGADVNAGTDAPVAVGSDTGTDQQPSSASGYRSAVLQDSPLAYFLLDETVRGKATSEVGDFFGVHTNGVEVGVAGLFPSSPTGVRLGNTNSIAIEGFDFQGTEPFSVELWLSKSSAPPDDYQYPFWKESGPNRHGYAIVVVNDGIGVERYVNSVNRGALAHGVGVGRVVHVVMTYGDETLSLYLDGVLASSYPDSRSLDAPVTEPARIGNTGPTANDSFEGSVDDVAVYDKALTADRIRAHFDARQAK